MPFRYHLDQENNPRGFVDIITPDFMSCNVLKNSVHFGNRRKETVVERDGIEINEIATYESGSALQHLFDAFFNWSQGELYELQLLLQLEEHIPDMDEFEAKLSRILAGRSIKVTMFRQQCSFYTSMNSRLCNFLRNYVDFKMFGTIMGSPSCADPLVICEKVLKCEFLRLDIPLANSEVLLNDFNGWGLKWYCGVDTQCEYLCLALDVSYKNCQSLISLGQHKEIERGFMKLVELEITREDGQFCRFGRLPLKEDQTKTEEPPLIYFYIGECSDELVEFNYMSTKP